MTATGCGISSVTGTTLLLDCGHPLHVLQDVLGHAVPRTTRRYDHARESLDRSPAYA